LNNNNSSKLF